MPDTSPQTLFSATRTDYRDRPFPHLVVDDLLPACLFDQILEHWPDKRGFSAQDDGGRLQLSLLRKGMLQSLPRDQADFWGDFITSVVPDIVREAMAWLGRPLFDEMEPGDGELVVAMCDLLQISKPFEGIQPHTHYHNPLLLGTCIIYVDDAGETLRGTDILGPGAGRDDRDFLAKPTLGDISGDRPSEMLKTSRRVPFGPNRGLIMMDGPISWHGATAAASTPGPHRQIIINWALGEGWMERRHGVTIDRFQEDRVLRPDAEVSRERLARDIDRQLAARQFPLEAARTLFKTVPVSVIAR
jgi:hypothetical protein